MPVEDFLFSAGGGFLLGAVAGYAIKKVMKIAAVVIGLFVAALAYLSYRGWVDVKNGILFHRQKGILRINGMKKLVAELPLAIVIGIGILIPTFSIAKVYGFNVGNQGSYQYGYSVGREGYQCSNFNADCDNGLGACDVGSKIGYWEAIPHTFAVVTNKAACLDGFVDGWKHWCNDDLTLCAKFVLSNVFPGTLANNETGVSLCLKDAGDNVPNDDPNNILSPLSKHCGGVVGEMTGGWTVNPPVTRQQEIEQQKDINRTYIVLEGIVPINLVHAPPIKTWNFVNYTSTGFSNSNSKIFEKGTITFGGYPNFKETADNGTIIWQGGFEPDPIIPGNSSLIHILEITGATGAYHPILYKITILNPNHVRLTDGIILNDENMISGTQNNIIDMTMRK